MTASYVVVALTADGDQVPEVVGPFRSYERAQHEMRQWDKSEHYLATIAVLKHGPTIRRDLLADPDWSTP